MNPRIVFVTTLISLLCAGTVALAQGKGNSSNTNFLNGKPFSYLNAEVQAAQADIADLQGTVDAMQQTIDGLAYDISGLAEQVDANSASIILLQDDLADTNRDLAVLGKELVVLTKRHAADVAALKQDIKLQYQEIQKVRKELKSAVTGLSATIVDLQSQVDTNTAGISGLLADATTMMSDILALEVAVSSHESRLGALEATVADQGAAIADLSAAFTNLEGRVATLEAGQVDLSGLYAEYVSAGRNVYFFKTVPCADLRLFETYCEDRGLNWWRARSQADAQQLIDFAYNLDQYHTWVQVYGMQTALGSFQTGYVDGYAVAVNSGGCVSASDDGGFAGVRRWGCSFGNPEDHGYESCNWDKSHAYDWFVCEN